MKLPTTGKGKNSQQSELRVLVQTARDAGCDARQKTLAAILYSANGLKSALEFIEFCRSQGPCGLKKGERNHEI